MFLLPYGHVQINTKLSKEAAERRLAEHLEPRRLLYGMLRGEHKFFEGSVTDGRFEMNRIVAYRNAFNPVLTGVFQPNSDHTVMDINVRFDFLSLMTIIIAFLAVLFFTLCLPLQLVRLSDVSVSSFSQFLVNALKIPAILYLIAILLFNVEAYKDLNYLDNLFAK